MSTINNFFSLSKYVLIFQLILIYDSPISHPLFLVLLVYLTKKLVISPVEFSTVWILLIVSCVLFIFLVESTDFGERGSEVQILTPTLIG